MTPPTLELSPSLSTKALEDDSDIFGPPRSNLFRSNRPRVSMISAKLRAKEERKKVIQICTEKLERIKDPDINLRRSVCINNTYFKLQDEVRREKESKFNNLIKPEVPTRKEKFDDLEKIDNELSALNDSLGTREIMLSDEFLIGPTQDVLKSYDNVALPCPVTTSTLAMTNDYMDCSSSRKRHFDEVDDRLVQEVLSHFYNQSTTKLLTTIDEDLLLNENKKIKLDDTFDVLTDLNQNETQKNESVIKNESNKSDFEIILDALRLNNDNKDITDRDNMLNDFDTKRFGSGTDSCGQAAIFADLQSTVFHNLMASLET